MVNGLKSLTVASKSSLLDVWLGFESISIKLHGRGISNCN